MKEWFLVFFVLALGSSSHAVMLSPPSYDFEFQPGMVYDCGFAVKNTGLKPMDFSLYTEGDLNGSIMLSEGSATINPNAWRGFSCTLTLPKDMTPGPHLNSVIVMEGQGEKGMVGAVAGVRMIINVRKPYPGKYVEADLQVPDSEINKPLKFRLIFTSRGSEGIKNAKASLSIFSPDGRLLTTLHTDSVNIAPGAVEELYASWTYDLAGVYHVVADVSYDSSSARVERDFRIGDLLVRIVNVSAPDARPDGIARVFVDAQSLWNERIDNVYASLSVKDSGGAVVGSADSPSTSFGPWESKTLNLYFDTSGLVPAVYDLNVLLRYSNKTSEASGSIRIVKPFPTVPVVIAAVIVIILVLLALYLFLRFRAGKKAGEKR